MLTVTRNPNRHHLITINIQIFRNISLNFVEMETSNRNITIDNDIIINN